MEDDKGNPITLEDYLNSLATYGEFDNKMNKPFLEFLSVLADVTIVIPLIDACLGVDIITGEDLSDFERGMKGVFAAVDTVTLMIGFKASGIAKVVGKESLKFAGKTITINIASNGVAYVVGKAGEEMDLPLPLTLLMSFAGGSITSTKLGTYAFKNSAGVDLLNVDKNVVDDLAEHLDDINGVTYKDVTMDDFVNKVNAGKIPDIDLSTPWKTIADDIAYQEWLRKRAFGKYVPPGMTAAEYEKFLKALEKLDETIALNKVDYDEVLKLRRSGVGGKGGLESIIKNGALNSYQEFSDAASSIGRSSDLTDSQKIRELQKLFQNSNSKTDINIPSDIQYVKSFDTKGNVLYDWPPKLDFDESTITSISRTNDLPDTCDKYDSFISKTNKEVRDSIDATYGLKGKAAELGDMSGQAGQIVTPFNGYILGKIGVLKEN